MSNALADERPPSVLLVSDHDWLALALGAVASGWGYAVGRAASLEQALHVADATNPDVVFVDAWLEARLAGRQRVGRALREAGAITPATPVVAFSADPLSRDDRLAALAGGAWDVVELPVDAPLLRLRLDAWLAAKRYADRLERASLLDREAPVYNLRGLLSRARELGADAARGGTPLACVAIGTGTSAGPADDAATRRAEEADEAARLRGAWLASGRASDVIGRVGRTQFVVLAPRTGAAGARVLADRLAVALDGAGPERVRTSVMALEPTPAGPDDAIALVGRAVATLQRTAPPELAAR
ncbi:response regulator [Roseisolibacter agri]|nr:response regulator [Roseisolibacter agri]